MLSKPHFERVIGERNAHATFTFGDGDLKSVYATCQGARILRGLWRP